MGLVKKLTLFPKVVILKQVMDNASNKNKRIFFETSQVERKTEFSLTQRNTDLSLIDFCFIRLGKNQSCSKAFVKKETVLVLIKGQAMVSVGKENYILGIRNDVFSERSHSIYIPKNTPFSILSMSPNSELVCVSNCAKDEHAFLYEIKPLQVDVKTVGKGSYRRQVHTIFNSTKSGILSNLIVGETYNEPGKWSSFPPHKHAVDDLPHETRYEEVYFFKVSPLNGFGSIRVYNKKEDNIYTIKNNTCCVVTNGYHPVCAAPESHVYYFWAMSGNQVKVINRFDDFK